MFPCGRIGGGANHHQTIGAALFLIVAEKRLGTRLKRHQRFKPAFGCGNADRAEQRVGKRVDAGRAIAFAADDDDGERPGRSAPQPRGAFIDEVTERLGRLDHLAPGRLGNRGRSG